MSNQLLPIDLVEAVQKGHIKIQAKPERSFAETRIIVNNRTANEMAVDFSRSYLVPSIGESQRIGLSYPKGFKPGDYTLLIKPNQKADIVFSSRCLDHHRPPPNASTLYLLAPQLLPDFIVDALRKGLNQQQVWEVIETRDKRWGNDTRSVPVMDHRAIIGEWESTMQENRYRVRNSWNEKEKRYEGHLVSNGKLSAEVGFVINELCWVAYTTNDPRILDEQQKRKRGMGGVTSGEFWAKNVVNMHTWTSWNAGIFADGTHMIRIT